jgi:hypothetical protein
MSTTTDNRHHSKANATWHAYVMDHVSYAIMVRTFQREFLTRGLGMLAGDTHVVDVADVPHVANTASVTTDWHAISGHDLQPLGVIKL